MPSQVLSGQEKKSPRASLRLHYLDWLRVLAILTVFVYHTTRLFNMEYFYVKNPTWYPWVEVWNRFATAWMLPLLFVISGASLFYAVGKGGVGKFVKDKALRLLVPWLVFVLTHQSLQFYLEDLSHYQFSGSYFQYLPQYYATNLDLYGAHLWYLWVLFLFSVLLYPLMRWFKGRGGGMLSKLGEPLALPGAVYGLALPAILLAALFDYQSTDLKNAGWIFIVYLWLTLAGFLVVSHERVQASIQQLRWLSLPIGLVLVGLSIFLVGLGELPAFGTWRYSLAWGVRALGSWCCVLAMLGFGRKYLDFSTSFLKYANEGVLPFYILHQTVLLSVGYFVVGWAMPDLLKWVLILVLSFAIIVVLYEFLVRRFNVIRFLFGMKPLPKALAVQPQEAMPPSRAGRLPSP